MPFDAAAPGEWVSIDFETRSDLPLPKIGVYRYIESPNTDVWCLAYAFDFEPVQLWEMGTPPPPRLIEHVKRGGKLRSWNMQFEWVLWNYVMARRYGWPKLKREQCYCVQAQALNMGLPMALEKTAEALGLAQGKDREGHKLMLQMCQPRLVQPDGSCLWWDEPEKRRRLGLYCVRDVETERAIGIRLLPMPDREREIWILDQEINERGMRLDQDLIRAGMVMVNHATAALDADVKKITNGLIENARKRTQILAWLHQHAELTEVESIDKHALQQLLKRDDLDAVTRSVLNIRRDSAKSSTAKLSVMTRAINRDGRIRGLLQYYGARQTGRWAGRLLQPHNFPKGHIEPGELEQIVADIKECHAVKNFDLVDVLHGPALDVMASLLRGCIVPSPGYEFIVVDFAAIEARVLAWLAGQRDLLHLFATGGDPYRVMAAKVYKVALEAVTGMQRFIGKSLVLGCGYNLGFETFQARLEKEGVEVSLQFASDAIHDYRYANGAITDLWEKMQSAAMEAIRHPGVVYRSKNLAFLCRDAILFLKMPSGRKLAYLRPSIETVTTIRNGQPWTRDQINYWGVDPVTYQWRQMYTYGGKLVENLTQATARDLLAESMLRLKARNYGTIVLHVHDEVVIEVKAGTGDVGEVESIAAELPAYMVGCPIKVVGWRGGRYRK